MAKQISALPTAPSTQRPATFNTEADAFVAALPTFVSEANALATEAAANAQRSEDANATAQSAKDAAQASAQTASEAKEAAARSASEAQSGANEAVAAKEIAASAAASAKQSEQAVEQTKTELQTATQALQDMKNIVKDGFIDDTAQSETKTYSSKKIEADFAPKNENTGEQKIYGKPLSDAGEANSIVVRDSGGYVSSSTPKSEEFTADHLVCVRGSDGKEKFVPLETIYKNALERILKENLSLRSYADIDIIESIAPLEGSWAPTEAKRLKNKNIFAYSPSGWGKAAVFTPSLEKVELAPPPGGENGYQVTRLIDDDSSIFVVSLSGGKLFKLIETSDSCSWEEVVLPMPLTINGMPNQSLNKFLYLKGSDGKIYKFDGRSATKTDINGSPSYISLDRAASSPRGADGFSEDSCYYGKSSSGVNKLSLKNLITTPISISAQYGAVSDFENFALFLERGSSNKATSAIMDIKKNKTIILNLHISSGRVYDYTDGFITQTFFLLSDEDIYILGDARAPLVNSGSSQRVIAKINKKMLAYYGIEI
ncbi:hypothetical protein [uncultured Campylobacter sp.]|uniref:hypothetical protein n=1 Tax=uncultured Campylobacter sp. TaxID=218934 RepID=UPI003211C8B5